MTILFLIFLFLIGSYSEIAAQTYKYIDKNGTVCFTQDPKKAELHSAKEGSVEIKGQIENGPKNIKELVQQTYSMLLRQCQEYLQDPIGYVKRNGINPCGQLEDLKKAMLGKKASRADREKAEPEYLDNLVGGGAVDVYTGEYYAPAAGGVINSRTGEFFPRAAGGYIHPRTGDFIPSTR